MDSFLCNADPNMIRATLMSSSDSCHHCVNWLERYFKSYGECAPNKDEIKLSITRKKEIFQNYATAMQDMKLPAVDQTAFYKIWNTLFPRCVHCSASSDDND